MLRLKWFSILFVLGLFCSETFAQKKIKSVILLIPDGTSESILSMARWFDTTKTNLYLDPYICGLLKTHSSNAPIGDSAPTSSWYSTGYASQTGFIATYPPKDPNDLVPVDSSKAYQPLMTVLEASKLAGKSTGLVVTCEYPHATPADFAAHWYRRHDYDTITKQMVYNNIDVFFGGGDAILKPQERSYLLRNHWKVVNSKKQFTANASKEWALLAPMDLPFDLDRDKANMPSLADMTDTALHILGRNNKGFFLMVEGSKVDWASHNNDPVGVITDFLAFDKAVKVAIDFAKRDGSTAVVICPDHSNGGITMGNKLSAIGYDKLSRTQLYRPLQRCKLTAYGVGEKILANSEEAYIQKIFRDTCGFVLGKEELADIKNSIEVCKKNPLDEKLKDVLTRTIARIVTSRTYIGFTTNGHTGDDVFLAVYNPIDKNDRPVGLVTSDTIHNYLCRMLGFKSVAGQQRCLDDSTKKYFSSHKIVFAKFPDKKIRKVHNEYILQVVNNRDTLVIPQNKNYTVLNRTDTTYLKSVVVFKEKSTADSIFYIPLSLSNAFKKTGKK